MDKRAPEVHGETQSPFMASEPDLAWLSNPEVFAVNRLPACSDHVAYPTGKEALSGNISSLRQSLNGTWKFQFSERLAECPKDFEAADFDASSWDEISVPGYMQLQDYGSNQYVNTQYPWDGVEELRPPEVPDANYVGSYIRNFSFPGNLADGRTVLVFDGVETAFYVWVNGTFVGYGEDSFTPSRFDVTSFLEEGDNRIAVRVLQRSSASWIEDQDFWRLTGIFRDVYLERQPACHIRDLFVTTDLADDFASADLRLRLDMALAGTGTKLVIVLKDADGNELLQETVAAEADMDLSIPVSAPKLWSAEAPNLHDLLLVLTNADGEEIEALHQRVGFRRFEMKDKMMLLNGKRIVFNGINRHEFDARRGRAVTYDEMLWDVRFFKQHNINAVRTCHYPDNSLWYQLCDEYGIYLIDEANLESHGSWQKDGKVLPDWVVPGDRPDWLACVIDRARSMQERDKNHPSILIWSCGNESYGGKDIFEMSEFLRHRDPSRLVHYEGIFHDRRYNATSDMESRMYAKPQDVEDYLRNDPEKPFILCEYMHAMGNSCGGMHLYTDLTEKYPLYQGGFIWDYIDQAIAVDQPDGSVQLFYGGDFEDRPSDYEFCGDGIVTAWRGLTPKVQEVKSLYQTVTLVPDRTSVTITNRNLFVSTADWRLFFRVLKDGEEIFTGNCKTDVAAGETETYALDMPAFEEAGEYALQCALQLDEPTAWADAGHELAFGEYIFTVGGAPKQNAPLPENLHVVRGDVNLGVTTSRYHAIFAQVFGGISSMKIDMGDKGTRELIRRPPRLNFWRAITDNDRGNKQGFRLALWQTATLYQKIASVTVDPDADEPSITYRFALPGLSLEPTVTYRVGKDGLVHVEADYPGAEGLPDLPLFGLQFTMDKTFDRFRFYGLGPDEAYLDRCRGTRLGIFSKGVTENLPPYLVPQESGNRMGVRWAEVTDAEGTGLRFATEGAPFEFNALPWTAEELESALRPEHLPMPYRTVVSVNARQMGVGGDDSWGAPVHDQYLIPASTPLSLRFTLAPTGVSTL